MDEQKLFDILKSNPPTSALQLINTVKSYVKDADAVVSTIEKIAAGADGKLGTDDDIIPSEIINTVKMLLEHRIVHELADEVVRQSCSCFN
jgi:hypothetical protein